MAAMLGGALKKKQAEASEEPAGRPDLSALFAGKGGKGGGKGGKGGGGMAGLLGGIAGRGGGGGIGGGLAGLKKSNKGNPMSVITSLKKERDKAKTELEATRNRGSKVEEAAIIVDALNRILTEFDKVEASVKERKLLEEIHQKELDKYNEYHKEIQSLINETKLADEKASHYESEVQQLIQQSSLARAQASEALSKAQSASLAYDQAIGAGIGAGGEGGEEESTHKTKIDLLLEQRNKLNDEMKIQNTNVEKIEQLVTLKSEEAKKLRTIADETLKKKTQFIELKQKEQEELGEKPPQLPTPLPSFNLIELGKKVGEIILKEKDFLTETETSAVTSANKCQLTLDDLQTSLEKWAKRKREAPERDAAEAERERQWAEENKADNEIALKKMRSFVPANLSKLTGDEFEALISERGGRYPPALLERLKAKKMLLWVITHPTNIVSANFLAGAHKVSFVNLQEYDFIEMRAIYAILPPYFLLDATPHHENEKKNWRENFVKTLKDLIVKGQMNLLTPLEARNPSYFYPTLEEAQNMRKKWEETTQRINEEEIKIPDLRSTLATTRAEYDKITIESREPALREILGKDALREWVKEAKAEVTKATKALAVSEDKVKRMKAEVEKNTETREKLTQCYDWCKDNDMYGKAVVPVFDESPVLEVESSAYKKLTDEEEVALRNAEKAALLASRQEADKGSSNKNNNDNNGNGGDKDIGQSGHGEGSGGRRSSRAASISQRKSVSGGGFGMRKGAKKDFMALLDSTLGGKTGDEGGGKGPQRTKSRGGLFGGKKKANNGDGSSPSVSAPPKPKPKPQVVLKKGTSTKLAELLKSKNSIGHMLSEVIVVPEPEVIAPLPNMSPLSPTGRKGGLKKAASKRSGSVSFATAPPPPPETGHDDDNDGHENLRDGVSEKPADWDHLEGSSSPQSSSMKKVARQRASTTSANNSSTLSSLMNAADDDQLLEQMRMKNVQDGDHSMKRVASKATIQDYGTLRRQQSRAALSIAGGNDRFTMSRTSSFASTSGPGVPRHLMTNSISSNPNHNHSFGGGGILSNSGHGLGNSGHGGGGGLRSLSRTASVATALQRGGLSTRTTSTTNTAFGFRGHPATLNGLNGGRMMKSGGLQGDISHSKSMHTMNRPSSGSVGNPQDLLASNYWSESRPRRNSQHHPNSRVRSSRSGSAFGPGQVPPSSSSPPHPKVRSRSFAPDNM
mmetsp:Transcript_28968/g.37392  ORF Transcript_28968/g.37392 Transcript_28968/m.37392 type:complete len:1202 (+) Transcript_28968:1-3606(+)